MPEYQIKHDVPERTTWIKRHRGGPGMLAKHGEITFILEARTKKEAEKKALIKVNEILTKLAKEAKINAKSKKD